MDNIQFTPLQKAAASLLADMMTVQHAHTDAEAIARWKATHQAVEKALDAYAAERERAARNAVCPRCRRGLAVESTAHADNEWDHTREDGKFGGVCLASVIRALMSDNTKETTNE